MRRPIIALLCQLACLFVLTIGPTAAAEQAPQNEKLLLKPDDLVYVVAHSAVDCPVCKVWRASSSGLPLAMKLSETWPKVRFVLIERRYLAGSEDESLYPPELHSLYQDRRNRYQMSPPTPLFEIVIRDNVVLRLSGLQAWNEQVIPSVQYLERYRQTASSADRK
jgi:hypothetical protein